MKKNSILFALLLSGGLVSAQQNFWRAQQKATVAQENLVPRNQMPSESVTMNLNYTQLVNYLTNTQHRNTGVVLKFPDAKGNMNDYKIHEQSNFHPDLQAKYGSIKSFVGYNVNDPSERINFSISPQFGLYGSIQGKGVNYLIDTYTKDNSTYIIYDKSNLTYDSSNFICGVEEDQHASLGIDNLDFSTVEGVQHSRTTANDSQLRTFRLAITTTTEYSNFVIQRAGVTAGTDEEKKAAILAAVNLSLTRINGVLRNDVGTHFELIPNTDELFFLTQDTFDATDAGQMIDENVAVVNNIIGASNYDIGHLFFKVNSANDSNGLAYTPSVCSQVKAGGVTGTVSPVGDPFDIDFTAHEMGHQLGAHHTQNNACNRSSSTSVEPGSGSTIMAYTGICAPNVQANSDAYYHQTSINQINNVLTSSSYNCGEKTSSSNVAPVILNTKISYNIPHSTAFALTLEATDENNDQLTYNWEQKDAAVATKTPPISSNTQGPTFRSFPSSTSPTRYFPRMEKILADQLVYTINPYRSSPSLYVNNNWEVVPSVARNLQFSGTVRDNNLEVGQTASKNFLVVLKNVGPFKVTSQATAETWTAGSEATITWDVAGTDANSINTANVKVVLSTDGGITWDYTLVESTPNNGSYTFTVPYGIGETTNARLMIQPVDNIYLAVNKTNFTINSPLAVVDMEDAHALTISPNPSNGEVTITTTKSYNKVAINVNDMTGRQVYNYNAKQSNVKSHKLSLNQLPNGVYLVTVKADGEQYTKKLIIKK